MTRDEQVKLIGQCFALGLLKEVGIRNYREIKRRNSFDPCYALGGACASHDFCDANVVMRLAFVAVMEREPDCNDREDTKLWNDAWESAWGYIGPAKQ